MKKICHITTVHQPFDTRIFHKEAKTLIKVSYDITLIAQHNRDETVEGVKIIALPMSRNRLFRIFFLTRKAYRLALRHKADIYHFHDPEFLPWATKLKKRTRAKIIYDIHENIPGQILTKYWIPKILRSPLSKFYQLRERKLLSFIDWIILAEDSYLKIYKGYNNVSVIRNYPSISQESFKKETKLRSDLPKLVYVGGISRERGILEMIQVIKILRREIKDIQLKIAGPTEKRLLLKIDSLIKYYKLDKNVIFYGRIPHPKALELISKADIGLSLLYPTPNYIESLPTKLFEYMAAGLPVVASNFPLWRKVVDGIRCGLTVNPKEPKEIVKAIKYLIEHKDVAEKMGENGRRAVFGKYNWEEESKRLIKLYKQSL